MTHNTWPQGQVDHSCHNADVTCNGLGGDCPHRRCCNPAHLCDATGSENQQGRRTRCRKGHLWITEGEDYVAYPSRWACLTCRKVNAERVAIEGQRHRKTICKRGHDLTDAKNIYIAPSGARQCVPCRNARARKANPVSMSEAGRRGAAARWGTHEPPS